MQQLVNTSLAAGLQQLSRQLDMRPGELCAIALASTRSRAV
jgi:hypothetical protein